LNIPKWIYDDCVNGSIRSFLDIGCAYGTLIHYVKNNFRSNAFAMDITDSMFPSSLSTKWGINFKVGDIENGSIPWDIKFDRIILTEVIEHLLNPLKALRNINAALSDDGKLFLSTPDAEEWGRVNKYYYSIDEIVSNPKKNVRAEGHVYQYDSYEIRYLLEAGEFEIEKTSFSPGACDRHLNIVATKA
jgi:SAM-dependent methyltransferase